MKSYRVSTRSKKSGFPGCSGLVFSWLTENIRIVGRVVAIINWLEVREQGIRKMRFGWFDFEDDPAVSEALLAKVEEIGKEHQMEFIEGPLGFSNLDKVGSVNRRI